MKIQKINNINFKGLFTDKKTENNGNWRMEYRPYSWETNQWGEYKSALQTEWDLFSDGLPDNEKRYVDNSRPVNTYSYFPKTGREYCKDMLGTEFYYHDFDTMSLRNAITEMPAMNREDSLKVYNKKLTKFLELKEQSLKKFIEQFDDASRNVKNSSNSLNCSFEDYSLSWSNRRYPKATSRAIIINQNKSIITNTENMENSFANYVRQRDSVDAVKEIISKNADEINVLEKARKDGKLIDISCRDIYDPNKALWDALKDLKHAVSKYVALPHKTISVKEILKNIGDQVKPENIPTEAIKYVDKLISIRK